MPRNKHPKARGEGKSSAAAAAAAGGGGGRSNATGQALQQQQQQQQQQQPNPTGVDDLPPPVVIIKSGGGGGGGRRERGGGEGEMEGEREALQKLHYGTLVSLLQEDALEVRIGPPSSAASSDSLASSVDADMYPEDRYDDRTHLMRGQKGSGARGTRKTVPGGRDAEEKRMRRKDEKKEKKKKKWIASWFTPSFVIVALVVLNGDSARGALFPTLWPLVSSLGGNRIVQGYVVSAFSAGRLISSPYIGRLSEVYGYRPVLLTTTLLLALGTLLYASATSIYHVLVAQVVMGLGSGTLGVTRAWVAEQTERHKRTILLAYLTAVQYAGFTVMPMAGGVLSDVFQGKTWRIIGDLRADGYTAPALLISSSSSSSSSSSRKWRRRGKSSTSSSSSRSTSTSSSTDSSEPFCPYPPSSRRRPRGGREGGRGVSSEDPPPHVTRIDGTSVSYWWPSRQDVVIYGGILLNLILGGMVFMVASMLLMLGPDSFPVWRFYLAIFLMYAVGYPVGHTAAIGLFSKILGKRPQGYLMGVFGSAGSLARVVFPIVGGIIAERVSENALFSSGAAFLSVSALLLLAARDEVLHISQAEH
ncbi:major facilitator superfamily [Nannochloropsis oceanica]